MTSTRAELLELTSYLARRDYVFICPTPESQERVVTKRTNDSSARYSINLEDFFGWSLPAEIKTLDTFLPTELRQRLSDASIITVAEEGSNTLKSLYRISNLYMPHSDPSGSPKPVYYIHSAFPTTQSDAVFFGPDTYLFLDFLARETERLSVRSPPRCIVDVCCGSGAGAIHMARQHPEVEVFGLDLNPKALDLGKINATMAECKISCLQSDLFSAVASRNDLDLIVSNPPYIASVEDGDDVPMYAAGGSQQGLALPLRIVEEGVKALASGGHLMLYTGVPISYRMPGYDPLLEYLKKIDGVELVSYRILHPDMFGEELSSPAYTDVGRIQVVGTVLRKNK